jgi:hypothetical protein
MANLRTRPIHEGFIRAVHRRLLTVRSVESLGVCLCIGSLAGLPLVLVLLWKGEPTWPTLAILGGLSALAAVAHFMRRWPTLINAAAEADRQLGLADLLVTAAALDHGRGTPVGDELSAAVRAMADARCRELLPSDVVLNRLGARAWGGIGLSTALVLTLALIPTAHPMRSQAADSAAAAADALRSSPIVSNDLPRSTASDHANTQVNRGGDQTSDDGTSRIDSISEQTGKSGSNNGVSHTNTNGTGGGASVSANAALPDRPTPSGASAVPPAGDKGAIEGSTGVSPVSEGSGTGETPVLHGTVNPLHARNVAPWESASWPAAARAAEQAVSRGDVSPRQRDLVREYFQQPND